MVYNKMDMSMPRGLENLEMSPFRVGAYTKTIDQIECFEPGNVYEFVFIPVMNIRNFSSYGSSSPDVTMVFSAWNFLITYNAFETLQQPLLIPIHSKIDV